MRLNMLRFLGLALGHVVVTLGLGSIGLTVGLASSRPEIMFPVVALIIVWGNVAFWIKMRQASQGASL